MAVHGSPARMAARETRSLSYSLRLFTTGLGNGGREGDERERERERESAVRERERERFRVHAPPPPPTHTQRNQKLVLDKFSPAFPLTVT